MRIICPFCEAAYDVPASLIAARRKLRCARCQGDWVADAGIPPEPAEAPPPQVAPPAQPLAIPPPPAAITPPERLAPEAEPPPRAGVPATLVLAAWVASFAVLGAAGWAAVNWRQPVMRAWPPSVRLYEILGLEN
jgi:predicted Zn finger-like uncharacterized protein